MEPLLDWTRPFIEAATAFATWAVEYLPSLLGGIVLFVFGLVVARFLKALTVRITNGLDRLFVRFTLGKVADAEKLQERSASVAATVVYWVTVIVFAAAAAHVLGLVVLTEGLGTIAAYIPNLVTGILIIVAGFFLGNVAQQGVRRMMTTGTLRQRAIIGRAAQGITVVTIFAIGLAQIGIDVSVFVVILAVMLGAFLGGGALAVGLGSQVLVRNIIGAHYISDKVVAGRRIRVGGHEGTILQRTPVSVVVETDEGQVVIPAKAFLEETSVLLTEGQDHD